MSPRCACGKPAIWSGFCQMEDGIGHCPAMRSAPHPSPVPRSTPADPTAAETDEAWLVRTVRELTGLECTVQPDTSDAQGDLMILHSNKVTLFYRMPLRGRDAVQVRNKIRGNSEGRRGWPLLDSPAVGSDDSSGKAADAASSEKRSKPEPAAGVPPVYCAECGKPATWQGSVSRGIGAVPLCTVCSERRRVVASVTAREPCGPNCRCVYCRWSKGEGNLPRADIDASYRADTDDHPRMVGPRHRLASLDRLERPRVSAESRELGKKHPWECDE